MAAVALVGLAVAAIAVGGARPLDLAVAAAVAVLLAATVAEARGTGPLGRGGRAESESFDRILRALSRSVSPDAIVEAIVHEVGAATRADHVAVVRLRPGSTVLDVTFVSMLPGAATSNTMMPARMIGSDPGDTIAGPAGFGGAASPGSSAAGRGDMWESWREGSSTEILGEAATPFIARRNPHWRPRITAGAPRGQEPTPSDIAERIAYRLRDAYGLRNTLAVPLQTERAVVGAIVLSRRTDEPWAAGVSRLLESAASETSAALDRVYTHQAVEFEARTDQLTQLPNRRYFDEYCTLIASRRRAADRLAILAIDVDHFKKLNDENGHPVGDQVLRAIGAAIQASVREEDVPARYGGEEFVVILRNPGPGVAVEIGERIRMAVRCLDLSDVGVGEVTVSVGVALGGAPGEPIPAVVERADRALYAAKRSGRDRVVEARAPDAREAWLA